MCCQNFLAFRSVVYKKRRCKLISNLMEIELIRHVTNNFIFNSNTSNDKKSMIDS